MATEHVSIADPQIHEPKGVLAAAVGQVYTANGLGSGAWSTPAAGASTVVAVETLDDFPTPVAGVITLAASTIYQINTIVNVSTNRFVFSAGSFLCGFNSILTGITTTTTGVAFSGSGVDIRMERLVLSAVNCSKLIEHIGGGTKDLRLEGMIAIDYPATGFDCSSTFQTIFLNSALGGGVNSVVWSGSLTSIFIDTVSFAGHTGIALDLGTATVGSSAVTTVGIFGAGGSSTGISGLASSANINTGGRFLVESCSFINTTELAGITSDDIQFEFRDNIGVANTQKAAHQYLNGSGLTTTIGTIDTPVLVNATTWIDNLSKQFSITTGGRITYLGISNIDVRLTGIAHGTGTAGTNDYSFYIAKNGTIDVATKSKSSFTSTQDTQVSITGVVNMSTGDFIELFIENNSGTTDYDLKDANIVVRVQ